MAADTVILSAGMPRSGSTWLFNVARLALSKVDGIDLGAGWVGEFDSFCDHDLVLVKIHNYEERFADLADGILYSYRDIRDAIASMKRKFGVEPTLKAVEDALRADVAWRRRANLVMRYEDFLRDKESQVQAILDMFGIQGIVTSELLAELEALEAGDDLTELSGHDSTNLLHPGHVTDGRHGSWEKDLDPELVAQIEKRYDWWLHENGYSYAGASAG